MTATRRAATNARNAADRVLADPEALDVIIRIAQAEVFGGDRDGGFDEAGSDSLDFFDCHVTALRSALAAAYAAGRMESLRELDAKASA